jgi:phosphatidylglycerophosphatase C
MTLLDTHQGPAVALFDLDGTISWHDTMMPFLGGYLLRSPAHLFSFWRAPAATLSFLASRDRGTLKSRVIRMVMGGERRERIEAWAHVFIAKLQSHGGFRPAALAMIEKHRAKGHHLVLLSASPDIYVPFIGKLLRFELTLSTEVAWNGDRLDGHLLSANRRGEEKSRCLEALRLRYPNMPIIAYGNSDSDLPHMRLADDALLVNANAKAREKARQFNIAVGDWN